MGETPRFEHDCDTCTFLGTWHGADLYVCPGEPTVIARHSDEGSDYSSGLAFETQIPALAVAADRARSRGLLD